MPSLLYRSVFGLGCLALLCFPLTALAQTAPLSFHVEPYALDSGLHDNARVAGVVEAYRTTVEVSDAPWLRLSFSEAALGKESYLTITSLHDGAEQRLDAEAIAQWQNTSAYFNGDALDVRLFVAPGEENIFIQMSEVMVGDIPTNPRSQCGSTDDRIASSDPAAGRIVSIGCTGWLIESGLFVSAGHCLGSGANVMEFNVPPSLANGTIQHPPPEDQYSIDTSSIVRTDGGVGNDWGVFRTFANTQTGLTALEAQGTFFNVVRDLGPAMIRITGYGVDSSPPGSTGGRNAQNQTQQTNAGPNAGSSGTTMRYQADTEGGNSGSPVIDDATGNAVGVHTHGGCNSNGSNKGTSTFNAAFWDQIDGSMPVAVFDPAPSIGLEATLAPSTTGTVSLTLSNDGNEDLSYDFLQYSRAARPAVPHLELAKGEADPRRGTTPTRGLGGPDAFGYAWIDSNEPDGPVFDFVDISGTGTALNFSDDDGESVPLPFTFEFYGSDKTQVSISSNGYLTFGSDETDYTNDGIPDDTAPNDLIAPFWDDLDPGDGVGQVYYQNLGDGRFVVQWENVPHYPGPGSGNNYTFQAILNDDGTMLFQYEAMDGDLTSATVGIENADGSIGLGVSSFAPYVADGLAVLIGQEPGFVTDVSPAVGSVPPGGSVTIDVAVSAEGLLPGDYTNVLAISTNEPATYTYPVRLGVTSAGLSVETEAQSAPVVLGPAGGTFLYDVTLTNAAASAQSFQAWVAAELPSGAIYGPVEGPRSLTLSAGQTVGPVTLEANVPAQAPAGSYTVLVRLGTFPDGIEAEGSFTFEKTGSARAEGGMTLDDWRTEGGLSPLVEAVSPEATASTALPTEVVLAPAYPNPFDRSTTLSFALPEATDVRLAVYDVLGRTVAVLVDGEVEAGRHEARFDAGGLAGGVYLVRLDGSGQVQTQRITLLK